MDNFKNKKKSLKQRQIMSDFVDQDAFVAQATYEVAHILGKKGKFFEDVEIIKECI